MSVRDQFAWVARRALRRVGFSQVAPLPSLESFAKEVDAEAMRRSAQGDMARLFYGHQGRLANKWDHYLPIYERHMGRFRKQREQPVRLLELGVSHGGSLQLWRTYFGPTARIFGVDVNPLCRAVDDADLCVRIGSQADPEFLTRVVGEMEGVDIVVDDASHVATHQRISFQTLFPLLGPGGIYIAEDLHTSYWYSYGGGLGRQGSFIEEMKHLIDDIHVSFSQARPRFPEIYRTVESIHFYDSIVVIEKGPESEHFHTKVGRPSF